MALGAQPRDVLKLVVREGLSLTLIGVAVDSLPRSRSRVFSAPCFMV